MRYFCLLALSGCAASSSDLRPLEAALGAAVSLAESASLAMQAMTTTTVCAAVKTPCTTYPCDGAVTVTFGDGCPLPLGGVASGTVEVSGTWQSADQSTLSTTFVDARAGTETVVVVDARSLTVQRSSAGVSVRYVGQNVNVAAGASTLSAQSSWTVVVDGAGTPGDSSDDKYTIDGTDQGVSGQVTQTNVSAVSVTPACRKNPVAGSATLQKVSTLTIVQADVAFHSSCDGKADVTSSGSSQSATLDFLH